jgi:hypothetical protein
MVYTGGEIHRSMDEPSRIPLNGSTGHDSWNRWRAELGLNAATGRKIMGIWGGMYTTVCSLTQMYIEVTGQCGITRSGVSTGEGRSVHSYIRMLP